MSKTEKLQEFHKMWTWLYKHPAHDPQYYVAHVAKPDTPWVNNCPLAITTGEDCVECLMMWDNGAGNLCHDTSSPMTKWRTSDMDDPDNRMWYAGKMVEMSKKALGL